MKEQEHTTTATAAPRAAATTAITTTTEATTSAAAPTTTVEAHCDGLVRINREYKLFCCRTPRYRVWRSAKTASEDTMDTDARWC